MNVSKVLPPENICIDALTSQHDLLYMSSNATRKIYTVKIKHNGVGLSGTLDILCEFPQHFHYVSYLCHNKDQDMFTCVPGGNGGIYKYSLLLRRWEQILQSTPNVNINALAITRDGLLFTNPAAHEVQMLR
ncbi:MAG: hypothetical protein GY697_10270 [Desulfobacterales bacterium]|nr:hypothetical protein [Desulfobacterales bacterium]